MMRAVSVRLVLPRQCSIARIRRSCSVIIRCLKSGASSSGASGKILDKGNILLALEPPFEALHGNSLGILRSPRVVELPTECRLGLAWFDHSDVLIQKLHQFLQPTFLGREEAVD
jgi:hypothetical protein